MASVVGSDDTASIVEDLGRAIDKVSAQGAPGGDTLIPKQQNDTTQQNGTTDGVNGIHDDYEIVSEIPSVSVTMERPAFRPKGGLKEAGIPRANIAASAEHPQGTTLDDYAKKHAHETVMQQHCAFFTRTTPGIIWPRDTFNGFHAIGFNVFLCAVAVLVIHANFSYPTLPPGRTWLSHFLPDLRFPVYVERIHKDKHGSDSSTFDSEGRFVPQKFEEIFLKYAVGDKGRQSISKREVMHYMQGQWDIMDPVGWGGSIFEWLATYLFLWPEDGRMKKEDIRRVYDGSIFFEFERREKERKEKLREEKALKVQNRTKEVRQKKVE